MYILIQKKHLLSLLVLLLTFGQSWAQKAKISGQVLDQTNNEPIEYASVAAFALPDSNLVTGAISNNKGEFTIENLPQGTYYLKVQFMGYKDFFSQNIQLQTPSAHFKDVLVSLLSSVTSMEDVVVVGQKEMLELDLDKKVFRADQSLVSQGGNATDLLGQIPSVTVDIDGNVALRGNTNVTVLINGKPSGLTGASRSAILEQIPASSIESIEVITNPSAKYDPDGMSGIINIVLKKNVQGARGGNLALGIGNRDKYNAALGLNARGNKASVFANYSYNHDNKYGWGTTLRTNEFADTINYLNQNGTNNHVTDSHLFRLGADFFVFKKSTLSTSATINTNQKDRPGRDNYDFEDQSRVVQLKSIREVAENSNGYSVDMNMGWNQQFAKKGQSLVFDFNYSLGKDNRYQRFEELFFMPSGTPSGDLPLLQANDNLSSTQTLTIQTDFTRPLTEKAKLETGYKSIIRDTDSDIAAQIFGHAEGAWQVDPAISNVFLYRERIHAAYGILQTPIGKIKAQMGLRAEQTYTNSTQIVTDEKFYNNYFNIFPSATFRYNPAKERTLQISYSKRINRPSINSLNPFLNYQDPYNPRQGNPYLDPEIIHSFEAGHIINKENYTLTTNVYYRHTTDMIIRMRTIDADGISLMTFQNLASGTNYGLEAIGIFDPVKWLNINASFNAFRSILNGSNLEGDLNNDNFSWSSKLIASIKFGKGWDGQISSFYNAPFPTLQGRVKAIYATDLALRKELYQGKMNASLRLSDLMDTRQFAIDMRGDGFAFEFVRKRESRIAMLTLTYNFGKTDKSSQMRKERNHGGGGMDDMM